VNNLQQLDPLQQLDQKLAIIRDRVRGVALGQQTGFYLYGRPGTSKTHTIRTTLDKDGTPYEYKTGHLTPIGLFDTISSHPDGLIVLDDIGQILSSPVAIQLLLAALGNGPVKGGRKVEYTRAGRRQETWFSGAIIMISNLELHGGATIDAIKSRVQTLNYDPTDEQLQALILHLAEKGLQGFSPTVCVRVAKYVLAECQRLNYRPEIRLYVDKALGDYRLWSKLGTETHWKDLVTSSIQQRVGTLTHKPRPIKRADRTKTEQQIARDIESGHDTREARLAAWEAKTGKSSRAFYRRLQASA